ncbi:MAG: hypothetical protein JNL82_01110 [Myxococcales bacterium]|nr:hypothetical protein [Myxococcales bacterium]
MGERLLGRLLGVRAGEGRRVAALVGVSLGLGVGLHAIDLAIDASLLVHGATADLPWTLIGNGAAVLLCGALLAGLRRRLPPTLFPWVPVACLGGLALLVVPARVDADPGFTTFALISASQRVLLALALVGFWTLAARCLDGEQSRRLYGLVGAGELLSALLAAVATAPLLRALGLAPMLAAAFALLLLATAAMRALARAYPGDPGQGPAAPEGPTSAAQRRLMGACCAYQAGYNLAFFVVELAVFSALQRVHGDRSDAIAAWLGGIIVVRIVSSSAVRVLLTGRILTRLGLAVGLAAAPVLVVLGASLVAVTGAAGLSVAVALLTAESAARHALGQPAFLAAQRPLPGPQRERTLVLVEAIVEPLSTGLAGALLLSLPATWLVDAVLLRLALPVGLVWLLAAAAVARAHRSVLTGAEPRRAGDP